MFEIIDSSKNRILQVAENDVSDKLDYFQAKKELPTNDEWSILYIFLGNNSGVDDKMKDINNWNKENWVFFIRRIQVINATCPLLLIVCKNT